MKFLPVFVLLVSGCASPRVLSKYGPTDERPAGEVRYLLASSAATEAEHREAAYREMFERCFGRYRIVSEFNDVAGEVAVENGLPAAGSWRYVTFECVGKPAPRPGGAAESASIGAP